MKKEEKHFNKCPICGRPTHKESINCIFHASAEEKTEEEFKQALKDYILEIELTDKEYNFNKFIFIGDIDFKKDLNITIFKNTYFTGATFKGYTDFGGTAFKLGADFSGITFKGDAYFSGITFKGDANFTGATFEVGADFKSITFKGDADFSGITFKGNAGFTGATFGGGAHFGHTTFKGDAYFAGATFKGYTNFGHTTFEVGAHFGHTTFKGDAYFESITFKGYTDFKSITFEVGADFSGITFKGNAYFSGITFKGNAGFTGATFEIGADFSDITFKGNAYFSGITFKGDADFLIESFVKNVTFARVNVLPGKKLNLKVKNNKGNVSLERAYLENIYLDLHLGADVLIDFTDTLLRNTKIERDQIENHILQEEKKEFFKAKKIYLLIKNNFHSIGKYEDESWAFKKEKDMERLSQSFPYYKTTLKNENKKESLPILKWIQKGNFKKWITSAFSNMIYGYGEKPWNVIKTAVAIILIFALFFSFIGLGNPEIIELKGTAIHNNSGNIIDLTSKGFLKNNVIRNFPDSLYFSTITFTTLGYGDFRPLEGLGRILAGSEAFLGAIMMALFVYTFARRTGGR